MASLVIDSLPTNTWFAILKTSNNELVVTLEPFPSRPIIGSMFSDGTILMFVGVYKDKPWAFLINEFDEFTADEITYDGVL